MVNILLVNDHSLIRRTMREIIDGASDLVVVAEASSMEEAVLQATQTQPDVVLLDVDMPNCDGLAAIDCILTCSPDSRIVIFTTTYHSQHIVQAIQMGAMGYVTRDVEPEALLHVIRSAARNDLCIPGVFASQMLTYLRPYWRAQARSPNRPTAPFPYQNSQSQCMCQQPRHVISSMQNVSRPLTEREKQILDLIRLGRRDREIARELCIAESTVHKHIQNIFEKLHAHSRSEAIYLTSLDR